jgi:hypothetical protein
MGGGSLNTDLLPASPMPLSGTRNLHTVKTDKRSKNPIAKCILVIAAARASTDALFKNANLWRKRCNAPTHCSNSRVK